MNEQKIEELKNALREIVGMVTQRGEPLTPELKTILAQTMEHVATRIQQLRQEERQPPEIPRTEIPPDAQLLWQLAGGQEQAFISYLRSFPTPGTQALLNNPAQLSNTMAQLAHRFPPGNPELWIQDGIPHAGLNSSNIFGSTYDEKTGKMKVRFQGGSVYEYDGVPANIYRAFVNGNASARTNGQNQYGRWWRNKNPSLGAAMNQYIKAGGFPYRRLR